MARTDGILAEKRRRHYGHAALLVGCWVELDRARGDADAGERWAAALRARTGRFPAFQAALREALARVKV